MDIKLNEQQIHFLRQTLYDIRRGGMLDKTTSLIINQIQTKLLESLQIMTNPQSSDELAEAKRLEELEGQEEEYMLAQENENNIN